MADRHTTVRVTDAQLERLHDLKRYDREPLHEVVDRLLAGYDKQQTDQTEANA